jgi:hypothetical protein
MNGSIPIFVASLLATGALAQQGPVSTNMSCSQVSRLVATRGAVVLNTGQYTYDRFVRSQAYCQPTEFTRPAWVPTADTPQCFIGYTCVDQPPNVGRLAPPGRKNIRLGSAGGVIRRPSEARVTQPVPAREPH